MDCFIIGAPSDHTHQTLLASAQEVGLIAASAPSLDVLVTERRFLDASHPLVLIPEGHELAVEAAVDFASEQGGRAFVVWLAEAIAPGDYKKLVRTGSAEWITTRDCREELRDLVTRLGAAASLGRAATALSFVPSKGGVGNTTVLIEMAVHLAGRRKPGGARIAILDLNLQGGTVADALDLEPRFDVMEIVGRPERLDEQLIDIFTSRHARGFDVFATALNRIAPDAVRPDTIFAFIDAIASRYDVLLFDLPTHWMSWTDDLLRGSDAIVVCGGESVPALRRLAATLTHLDSLAIPEAKVAAVVNPVETGLLQRPARRAVIARALAGRRMFPIRHDDGNARNALDVGRPILELSPGSGIGRDLKRLASWIETVIDQKPSPLLRPHALRDAAA